MAYTIAVSTRETAENFRQLLDIRVKESTRFSVEEIELPAIEVLGVRAQERGDATRLLVRLRKIRLTKGKPYCGQHPGECVIGILGARPKPVLRCLEWGDWIAFNDLVNDVLDAMKVHAEVWSHPGEPPMRGHGGKRFWIRKAGRRRVLWEWEEESRGLGQPIRRWNMGSDSQFVRQGEGG
jgi:hypothetical protein